ncbi:hypothetical protein QUB80_32920 [Chlorogloeopsis sp. ULAP01]|uniref:hypothetical protein n=1 Tax=Chlorogloeopsis sp. ULAP01 TaxID=3056483 RepID=UPI0025AB4449|nr:hypothetical protein [Chlorogloeopsis sp. ULAP01]MDM9385459.1 hypothetical protein [Chlorogloeopsis sp. ULAP01]
MNNTQKFTLKLEEPWTWEGLAPPEDPLRELSDLEIGLRRFCFECNHKVLLEIGNEKKYIFLDPDIILILDSLPQQVSELSLDKKIELDFPESYMYVEFVPTTDNISCTLTKFGSKPQQKSFELNKTQVIRELKLFLEQIIDKAVDGGYITFADKEEFMMPVYKLAIC